MHLLPFIVFAATILLSSPGLLFAAEPLSAPVINPDLAKLEITPELDAYYTNIGVHFPLTDKPIPDVGETDELAVYKGLLRNSFKPRFMLIEASICPLPVLGTYLKRNHRGLYDTAGFDNGVNLIGSITAGFQEPYALSLFFGDIVTFVRQGEDRTGTNKGYMGYLFTYADHHIKNNILIDDKSLEIEWKLKGEKNFKDEKLSWSFRLGSKIHGNPNIADIIYLGLRRSNLDFNSSALSWLKNSSFDFRWDLGINGGGVIRQEYTIGKKLPLKEYNLALKFDFGVIWENSRSYSGELRALDQNALTLVFRPNIQF